MPYAITRVDQRFASAIKNTSISCLTSIFDVSNPKLKIKPAKICSRLRDMTIDIPFFQHIVTNLTCGLVVKVSCSVSGKIDLIPLVCWNSAQSHRHFAWPSARQWLNGLTCAHMSRWASCKWQSHADRILTLKMNIWLLLFWALGVVPGLAHICAGLANKQWLAVIIEIVKPLSFSTGNVVS